MQKSSELKGVIWRAIPDINDYEISADGFFVRKVNTDQILKTRLNNGYLMVRIVDESKVAKFRFVHHLSLYADGRPKPASRFHCDHKNGNRLDNRPENLEWVLPEENVKRAYARKYAKMAAEALEILKEEKI